MNTETLVTQTIEKIGKKNFVIELDIFGWRGDYDNNPAEYLMNYINHVPAEDRAEAEEIVRTDMIWILNAHGYDVDDDGIIDIVVAD